MTTGNAEMVFEGNEEALLAAVDQAREVYGSGCLSLAPLALNETFVT